MTIYVNVKLRKISVIWNYVTVDVTKTFVSSLVFSRLDYCNSLLAGTIFHNISRLQTIKNKAASLILKKECRAYNLPMLYELHWLPVSERIDYKIALLCYKCLCCQAPTYLNDFLKIYTPKRSLRSSSDEVPVANDNHWVRYTFIFLS